MGLKRGLTVWVALLCFASNSAVASYRVYQLKIDYYSQKGKVTKTETVLATLDPNQYWAYHNLRRRATVKLKDTWYCPGDTSRRDYCKKPKSKKVPTRGPASTTEKRVGLPRNLQPVIP